jgi:Phage integrase, N-terminal SAM-like domain
MGHPREMGMADVEAFLSMLANERRVPASTHNQAVSALLFLYREVLVVDLPWLNNIGRPQQTKRIPSVLIKDEVAGLLAQMEGLTALLTQLLYGTGMRLMEGTPCSAPSSSTLQQLFRLGQATTEPDLSWVACGGLNTAMGVRLGARVPPSHRVGQSLLPGTTLAKMAKKEVRHASHCN